MNRIAIGILVGLALGFAVAFGSFGDMLIVALFGVLGYGRALARAVFEGVLRLINLLFFLLGLVWVLDMLFPLWDKKRQTLHDKVAGSVVLRVRPAG